MSFDFGRRWWSNLELGRRSTFRSFVSLYRTSEHHCGGTGTYSQFWRDRLNDILQETRRGVLGDRGGGRRDRGTVTRCRLALSFGSTAVAKSQKRRRRH